MARMMAGACRVLELFISRFDRRKARRSRRYPSEARIVAAAGARLQPTTGLKYLQNTHF